MQTGKTVQAKIAANRFNINSSICAIDGQISATEREIERQNLIREQSLTRLAEIFAQNGGELAKNISAVSQRVQKIFNEKAERRTQIIQYIKSLDEAEVKIKAEVEKATRLYGEAADRTIDAQAQTAHDLKNDPAYVLVQEEIEKLKELIKLDDERLASLTEDCRQKMLQFENDGAFAYLLKINYGTKEYHAGWFPRLDRWLARISYFEENFRKYTVLWVIPERVRAANEGRRVSIANKIAARDEMAEKIELKYDVKTRKVEEKALEKTKDGFVAQLKELNTVQAKAAREKNNIDSGDCKYEKSAKEALKSFFGSQTIADLRRAAASTSTMEDNDLVAKLESSEKVINDQRKRAKDLILERKPLEDQLTRVKSMEQKFSECNYDSPRSRFDDNLDVDALVLGVAAGAITADFLSTRLSTAHQEERRPSSDYGSRSSYDDDSYRRPSSYDSGYSSHSSGGRDSGGGHSTGGMDSGGGFSSGGYDSSSSDSGSSSGGGDSGGGGDGGGGGGGGGGD